VKVLASFALLGFIAGVAANIAYHRVLPALLRAFPELLRAEWILSGLVGSVLTLLMLVLWAYTSGPAGERG